MMFIEYIDKLYTDFIKENKIENDKYIYSNIILIDSINIVYTKSGYTKFFILYKDNVRIYLLLSDIIDIIKNIDKISNKLKTSLKNYILGINKEIEIKIEGNTFKIKGLECNIEDDFKIETRIGYEINLSEFISILNLVLSKDDVTTNENDAKLGNNGIKLAILIYVICFFKDKSFLKNVGYTNLSPTYINKKKMYKTIDVNFFIKNVL